MTSDEKKIVLEHTGNRRPISMAQADYEVIRSFILQMLSSGKEVLLANLIEEGLKELENKIKGDIGWHLLRVKEDLICRKILIVTPGNRQQRLPALKLKKKLSLTEKELYTQYT
jgi:hypothetical protein